GLDEQALLAEIRADEQEERHEDDGTQAQGVDADLLVERAGGRFGHLWRPDLADATIGAASIAGKVAAGTNRQVRPNRPGKPDSPAREAARLALHTASGGSHLDRARCDRRGAAPGVRATVTRASAHKCVSDG